MSMVFLETIVLFFNYHPFYSKSTQMSATFGFRELNVDVRYSGRKTHCIPTLIYDSEC